MTILNERTFNNGREVIQTPIQSIVAATNSFPTEESLQAFCDRFLFRPTVEPLKKPTARRLLDLWALGIEKRPVVTSDLTYSDLTELQKEAENIEASDEFLDRFSQVFDLLASRGITISDRRRVQILRFMKAWALVQGDELIYAEHLHRSLIHIVYQTTEDIPVIKEVLDQAVPTAEKMIAQVKRAHNGLMTEYHAIHSANSKNLGDLNSIVSKLRKQHNDLLTLEEKLDNLLEANDCRITITARRDGVKLSQAIEQSKQMIAQSISDITP